MTELTREILKAIAGILILAAIFAAMVVLFW